MEVTVIQRHGPITTARSYFHAPVDPPKCDILHVRHIPDPMQGDGWVFSESHTLCIDLLKDEEQILKGMDNGTRYKIKRAMDRDMLHATVTKNVTPESIEHFNVFYSRFAEKKGLPKPKGDFLHQLFAQGALSISWVTHEQLGEIAYHLHMLGGERARLVFSAVESLPHEKGANALTGRANRMLHWKDICHFKSIGMKCYDFGGLALNAGQNDPLGGITEFKLGFGGTIVREYKCRKGLTLKGRAAILLQGYLARLGK